MSSQQSPSMKMISLKMMLPVSIIADMLMEYWTNTIHWSTAKTPWEVDSFRSWWKSIKSTSMFMKLKFTEFKQQARLRQSVTFSKRGGIFWNKLHCFRFLTTIVAAHRTTVTGDLLISLAALSLLNISNSKILLENIHSNFFTLCRPASSDLVR